MREGGREWGGKEKGGRNILMHSPSQLKLQKQDLEKWREEWSVFQTALSTFQDWVGLAEETVERETYGNDVVETERYLKTVVVSWPLSPSSAGWTQCCVAVHVTGLVTRGWGLVNTSRI